jgi:hypothetical protein
MYHPCLTHDKNFPEDKMACNPNSCLCSDCPFTKEELSKRNLKKYGGKLIE